MRNKQFVKLNYLRDKRTTESTVTEIINGTKKVTYWCGVSSQKNISSGGAWHCVPNKFEMLAKGLILIIFNPSKSGLKIYWKCC